MATVVGVLHPGAMGSSVAACAKAAGADVCWASTERSPATRQRAEAAGLRDVAELAALAAQAEVIVSVCPPSEAFALAVCALSRAEGVEQPLLDHWARTHPGLAKLAQGTARATAPKAWRFAGEMQEIAATFAAAGLPSGFHRAAAELYARLASSKDAADPTLDAVLAQLLASDPREAD